MKKLKEKAVATLLWLEQYTKTDMLYLAHGGFWSTLSQVVVAVSTFLLAVAFAHFVSKQAYGQYKYILSIASILGAFTLNGLSSAVTQSATRGYEGTLKYAFWQNIKWSALFILLSLGGSIYYFAQHNTFIGTSMLVVGLLVPFWNSTDLYNDYLAAKKDWRRSAIYFNITGNLFPAICLFTGILFHSSPLGLVIIYFVSNTLIGLILYIKTVRVYKPNKKVDTEVLSYAKHLSFLSIIGVVANNIDQVLVFHYMGAIELAVYNFATAIPSQIKGPIKGFAGLIFPKFVERSDKEIKSAMKYKYMFLLISALCIIAVYIIAAPYIFRIFFPKYADAVFYSQIFSLSILSIVAVPANAYFEAKKKIKEQYLGVIIGFFIQIILLYFGVRFGGLLGFIIAQTLIKILWALLNIVLYERSAKLLSPA